MPLHNTLPSPASASHSNPAADNSLDGVPYTPFSQQLTNAIHQARLQFNANDTLISTYNINSYQLNCHRSLGPLDNLQYFIASKTSPYILCFLQEPPTNNYMVITGVSSYFEIISLYDTSARPRAALLLSYPLALCSTPLTKYITKDLAAARISGNNSSNDFVVCSLYLDGKYNVIPASLINLCIMCHNNRLPLIIGGDVNAHHTAWGSSNVNNRGNLLMDFILQNDLSFFNDGSTTFHNVIRDEAIDLTLGNTDAIPIVSHWTTSPLPSLSDHSLIRFDISAVKTPTSSVPPLKRVSKLSTIEYSVFVDKLAQLVTTHANSLSLSSNSAIELNNKVDLIQNLIHKALKQAKTFNYVSHNSIKKKLSSP